MNASSETLLKNAESQVEPNRQEPQQPPEPALVELGKVSDTKGGWFGSKIDSGLGVIYY